MALTQALTQALTRVRRGNSSIHGFTCWRKLLLMARIIADRRWSFPCAVASASFFFSSEMLLISVRTFTRGKKRYSPGVNTSRAFPGVHGGLPPEVYIRDVGN